MYGRLKTYLINQKRKAVVFSDGKHLKSTPARECRLLKSARWMKLVWKLTEDFAVLVARKVNVDGNADYVTNKDDKQHL